jgi:hypothetical protein
MKPKDFRILSAAVKGLAPHRRQVLMDRLQPATEALRPATCWRSECRRNRSVRIASTRRFLAGVSPTVYNVIVAVLAEPPSMR